MSPSKIVLHLLSIEILGWHVIIWDGSQVKAFPIPDKPPLKFFLTYQALCTASTLYWNENPSLDFVKMCTIRK